MLAAVAGCAPRHDAAPAVAGVTPPPQPHGLAAVIVSVRSVASSNARSAVLDVLRAAGAGTGATGTEFIVRDASGRTLSIVQANPDGLRRGDRVELVAHARTTLVRAAGAGAVAGGQISAPPPG